jgi:hypothetical protein
MNYTVATPRMFFRRSNSDFAGIPAKAGGNDGLQNEKQVMQRARGKLTRGDLNAVTLAFGEL